MMMSVTDMEIEDNIHVSYNSKSDSYDLQFGEIFVPDVCREFLSKLHVEIAHALLDEFYYHRGNE